MYHEIGIQKLSENQLSKLRNGHPVRVKLGNHHKICLSVQQLKKLHKASKKGSASTITFDPYQLEAHGSGILGNIGRKAKAFIQKYKLQDIVNPVINRVKNESHKGVNKLSHYAHSKINEIQPIEQGEGFIGDVLGVLGNVAKTAGFGVARKHHSIPKKPRAKKGKGVIGDVLGVLGNVAKTAGFGVAHKKPRTRKGKGIITDLAKTAVKSVANKGIEMGADYLKDKISGMGNKRFANVRRIVGRKAPAKKTFGGTGRKISGIIGESCCGGAMYPGGYGGALYPGGYGGALYPSGC